MNEGVRSVESSRDAHAARHGDEDAHHDTLTAGALIRARPIAVRPDARKDEIEACFAVHDIGRVAVLGPTGTAVGCVFSQDVAKATSRATAHQLQHPLPPPLPADASPTLAAARMAHENVYFLPMQRHDGTFAGFLEEADVLEWVVTCSRGAARSSAATGLAPESRAVSASADAGGSDEVSCG